MHWRPGHLYNASHTHHKQMQIYPCMRAYAMVQQVRCHGNYCELSWVLWKHRAGCWLPHAYLLSRRTRRDDCLLKETIQIHAESWRCRGCVVAQASPDHPRWCGPHPASVCFTLTIGRGAHSRQYSVFAIDLTGFFFDNIIHHWDKFLKFSGWGIVLCHGSGFIDIAFITS